MLITACTDDGSKMMADLQSGGAGGGAAAGGGNGGRSGNGGGGGHQVCEPVGVLCGGPPVCPGFGGMGGGLPLTLSTATVAFDPDDPRWVDLYRACVSSEGAVGCGPNCRGLCSAVVQSVPGVSFQSAGYLKCDVTCGSPSQLTASFTGQVCGRRPSKGFWGRCVDDGETPLGRFLARAAELEAASVPAFRRVAAELSAHGAPSELVGAARSAMADEARHWRHTRDLARRRGGRPCRQTQPVVPLPSLEEAALDNVVEGCVRETYGAMVATYQAATAADPEVRQLMTHIAHDELAHAALAWRIDAWASAQLGRDFQRRRGEAGRGALRELIGTSTLAVDAWTRSQAGLPTPHEANELLGSGWTNVWRQVFAST
ncbi:MAG: ferritin-like domain-containing protein [Myxococcales bacterium]